MSGERPRFHRPTLVALTLPGIGLLRVVLQDGPPVWALMEGLTWGLFFVVFSLVVGIAGFGRALRA